MTVTKSNHRGVRNEPRRTKSSYFHGIVRVDETEGKGRHGWTVLMTALNKEGKQIHLFPSMFFSDDSTEQKHGYLAKVQSRDAAIAYRDSEMLRLNLKPSENPELLIRERTTQAKETRSRTRTDPELYGISRDLRTTTPSLAGWRVRINNKSKHFSDSAHGGTNGALIAAKNYRDELTKNDPPPHITRTYEGILRLARVDAGISQDLAAQYMHTSLNVFARMERNVATVLPAFEELFCRYVSNDYPNIKPLATVPKMDLIEIRLALGKTQSEMSYLISGSKSQAPWVGWETGKTNVPAWVLCFIEQIGFEDPVFLARMQNYIAAKNKPKSKA